MSPEHRPPGPRYDLVPHVEPRPAAPKPELPAAPPGPARISPLPAFDTEGRPFPPFPPGPFKFDKWVIDTAGVLAYGLALWVVVTLFFMTTGDRIKI